MLRKSPLKRLERTNEAGTSQAMLTRLKVSILNAVI